MILVCVDRPEEASRIVHLLKAEFPLATVIARSNDRRHSLELIRAGVDVQIRETFESALVLGAAALEKLGTSPAEVAEISARIRQRDQQRLELELLGGIDAGRALFSGRPAPADAPPAKNQSA